MITIYLALL